MACHQNKENTKQTLTLTCDKQTSMLKGEQELGALKYMKKRLHRKNM